MQCDVIGGTSEGIARLWPREAVQPGHDCDALTEYYDIYDQHTCFDPAPFTTAAPSHLGVLGRSQHSRLRSLVPAAADPGMAVTCSVSTDASLTRPFFVMKLTAETGAAMRFRGAQCGSKRALE